MKAQVLCSPIAFSHSDSSYGELIVRLQIASEKMPSKNFAFSAKSNVDLTQETKRRIFSLPEILQNDPKIRELLLGWIRSGLPTFMTALFRELDTSFDNVHDFSRLRLALRVRLFEDQPGYFLAPHQDSSDTLLALILQLSRENPATSLFFLETAYNIEPRGETGIKSRSSFLSLRTQLGFSGDILWTENQFGEKLVAWERNGNVWLISEPDPIVRVFFFRQMTIPVNYGELYAIHNPLTPTIISSNRYEEASRKMFHGVMPNVFQKRRVLLMDLIGMHSDSEKVSFSGDTSDKDSYFIFLKEGTKESLFANLHRKDIE